MSCLFRAPLIACAALLGLALAGCGRPEIDAERFSTVAGGDAARGQRVMTQYQCGSCHRIPGVPAATGGSGPPLDAFGQRSYIAGEVPNNPASLQRWLQAPPALVPDTAMPPLGVTPADARDMAAYLLSLR